MSERGAARSDHEAVAEELRALIDLVATHEIDAPALAEAKRTLAGVRASLARSATSVPTSDGSGVARWPAERSAVSGALNPFAPPLSVDSEGDAVVGTMRYPRSLQGPPEHAHGGHLAMVFDHLAARAAARTGKPIVTGKLAVRYLRPTPVGEALRFTAKVRESRHSLITVECEAHAGGVKTCTAEITFVELGPSHYQQAFGTGTSGEN